jgi:hypothetical protein
VVDALLLPSPNGGGLRLWAALANDGLAYADLTAASSGGGGGGWFGGGEQPQQQQQQGRRALTRLWAAPCSIDDEVRCLLPSPAEAAAAATASPPPYGPLLLGASAGSAFSDGGGNRDAALRQQLWALHQQLGGGWAACHRHIESGFLRLLAAPRRHSALGLSKAMARFSSSSSSSTAAATAGARGGSPAPGGGGGGSQQQDELLVGERLWEAVAACVRREAEAEMERRRLQHGPAVGPEAAAFVEGERRARALWGAWRRFVGVAEESREVLGQPLGLVPPLEGQEEGKEDPVLAFGPLVVRYVRLVLFSCAFPDAPQ